MAQDINGGGAPRKVVVGVDRSARARQAAVWAAEEAAARSAELHIVHAYFDPGVRIPGLGDQLGAQVRDSAQELIDATADACTRASPGLAVRTYSVADAAVPALTEHSRRAELVVVGDRGSGGFTGLMVGSVGVTLASRAVCPVVVVRPITDAEPSSPVVVGLGDSGADDSVMAFALDTAATWKTELVAVHGWSSGLEDDFLVEALDADASFDVHLTDLRTHLEQRMQRWRRRRPDVPVALRVVHDKPAVALLEEARRAKARLVVVGAEHGSTTRVSMGATTHSALHYSPCPVALVGP